MGDWRADAGSILICLLQPLYCITIRATDASKLQQSLKYLSLSGAVDADYETLDPIIPGMTRNVPLTTTVTTMSVTTVQ